MPQRREYKEVNIPVEINTNMECFTSKPKRDNIMDCLNLLVVSSWFIFPDWIYFLYNLVIFCESNVFIYILNISFCFFIVCLLYVMAPLEICILLYGFTVVK